MNKSLVRAVAFQQTLSFLPALGRMSQAEAIFWPGCALMSLDPVILRKTYEVLRREEADLGLSSLCCAQPSQFIVPERFPAREEKIGKLFREHGVKRVYTACPNCTKQLSAHEGVEVIALWPVLKKHILPEDIIARDQEVALHDPCPFRKETEQQEAVRELLQMSGTRLLPVTREKAKTRCCGNFHMMIATDPEKSRIMRENRLSDFPEGAEISSYCEGCLNAFRREGRETVHVLELLFGRSEKRSWLNRLRYSRSF